MRIIDEFLNARPDKPLFHYTNTSGLLGVLNTKQIWASSAYHMNDTGEFRFALSLMGERIKVRLRTGNGNEREEYRAMLDALAGIPDSIQAYVASFSEEGDLLSQWLTYPRSQNGYAIGFRAEHFATALENGFQLVRCIYEEDSQNRLADAMIDVFRDLMEIDDGQEERGAKSTLGSELLVAASAIKHSGFAREAEWRLVKTLPVGMGQSKPVSFRDGRNGLVPFLKAPLASEGKSFKPDSIHIGPSDDMRSATIAMETLLDSMGFKRFFAPDVIVVPSKTPYRP